LHTAPLHDRARADYHWHWELLPRTTGIAGFELASGWFINPLPPETAAERLRG
jgi:UDPglucose--hexose-1-phosphate uridylyltransferase